MTESLENYLEAIGVLDEMVVSVRVTDVASHLGVSKPAVHNALHELESRGLVAHQQYGTIELTANGVVKSHEIRERHDLLKGFLCDLLGVAPGVAESEACAMEHDLSGETLDRIAALTARCKKEGIAVD